MIASALCLLEAIQPTAGKAERHNQCGMSEALCPHTSRRCPVITEFSFQTQTSNFDGDERTTGTINPGLLYVADKYQLGVEAIIPLSRTSGDDVGVIANLHLFLEDIFPNSLGRPLLASATDEHPEH